MKILLIEDDKTHCEKYRECAEHLYYPITLSIVNGSKQAFKHIEADLPEIILLDLELNDSDGDGLMFLKKFQSLKLKPAPFIIIITNNSSKETIHLARNLGADYVISKQKPDYSPRFVFDFVNCSFTNRTKTPKEQPSLEALVKREVEKIGFTFDLSGKNYLISAILTVIHANKNNLSLKKEVYPVIARMYKKSDESVERAIRTAIIKTWRITDLETLQENYTANVDYGSGFPTNKELIFYVAERIQDDVA